MCVGHRFWRVREGSVSMNVTTSGRGVWVCPCVCTATVGWPLGMRVREEDFLLKYQLLELPALGSHSLWLHDKQVSHSR